MVAMNEIQAVADHIAREFHPDRIILFGSHAYGEPSAYSDVDLLVVVRHEGNPLNKAVEIRSRLRTRFCIDVIVRDPEDLRWRIEQHDWFLKDITEKGIVLYEAADRRVGGEG